MALTKVVDGVTVDCTAEEEAAILAQWAAADAAAAAPKVPSFVTKRQGMAELIDRDLLATVQGVLDGITGKVGDLARNDFTNSQEWQRSWPLIAQLQPVLSWSDAFVDEMFISAKAR